MHGQYTHILFYNPVRVLLPRKSSGKRRNKANLRYKGYKSKRNAPWAARPAGVVRLTSSRSVLKQRDIDGGGGQVDVADDAATDEDVLDCALRGWKTGMVSTQCVDGCGCGGRCGGRCEVERERENGCGQRV
jgi:hypothetical protein